jgi:hypothetical protein
MGKTNQLFTAKELKGLSQKERSALVKRVASLVKASKAIGKMIATKPAGATAKKAKRARKK